MALHVELVSPERILFSGEATMVLLRAGGGDIAFLTGHAPFLGALGVGVVRIQGVDGRDVEAAVHGGFVEVKDDRVIILSDVAELADQIDVNRARQARDDAQARLRSGGADSEEAAAQAAADLRRAEVRLQAAHAA
ncbi:MAG TPA: ATP synthase F1 subunit epsilon [Acidimicrobiales bacterium]|nr:ATP synthase F1 subunit epsilon [Acidimicrobiales bacterium]